MLKPLNLSDEAQPVKPVRQFPFKTVIVLAVAAALGAASGFGLFSWHQRGPKILKTQVSGTAAVGETYGVNDTKAFSDSAEGELAKGGIDGEGSHHLVRPGGESQSVYLTSSVIDLDQFIGRQVKVWGQTFQGQKAGWLMDVGRLEVTK